MVDIPNTMCKSFGKTNEYGAMGSMHNADWGCMAQKFKNHWYQVKDDSERMVTNHEFSKRYTQGLWKFSNVKSQWETSVMYMYDWEWR